MDEAATRRSDSFAVPGPNVWRTTVPVRFSHCDPAGIVYFARYFDMLNGVVEDWFLEALQIDYYEMIGPRRVGLGYVSANADFKAPGRMGDRLECAVVVDRIGNTSMTLHVHVCRGDEVVLRAGLVIVTTSLVTHRAIAIPDDLRAAATRYQENCQ
jgi:4-hydroxybenzoyl-CoA thioesterase